MLVYHDNAPTQNALSAQLFMAKNKMIAAPSCLYFLYHALCNYLFPKMKVKL